MTVATKFVIDTMGEGDDQQTWLTLLDAVLQARIEQDPEKVPPELWKAFLLFAFVLVPCVQSW
jgi:hypothetical protein